MRIGVFGGSFDPVHIGHLILAEQCRWQARLDKVYFVPAPRPPHKHHGTVADYSDRVDLLRLALESSPDFFLETCEEKRVGPSYTVDTLRYLRQRESGHDWFLILGADSVRDLETWREPEEIAKLCRLLTVERPGIAITQAPSYFECVRVESPLVEISSTMIRDRCRLNQSIRYLTPANVEKYLIDKQLYSR